MALLKCNLSEQCEHFCLCKEPHAPVKECFCRKNPEAKCIPIKNPKPEHASRGWQPK